MDGFDTMAMPYLASPLSLANIQGSDYLNALPGMDLPDQRSNFDSETFVSGDDLTFPHHTLPPETLKRFSGYEDPFTDMVTPFDPAPPAEPPADSSIDHNNKLLSFSIPSYPFTLLDYSFRRTSISVSAQLHGMFFLAESPWTTSPTENAPPQQGAELTCYRRNLFQITGSVTLPRGLRYIITDTGDRIPIVAQELTVSATESVEGNSVKIISVPWKTPAANGNSTNEDATNGNNPSTGAPKVEKEPPAIPLDMMAGQDLDTDYATFPIAWKRLQFRVATANNGRRKELQQHFVVRLKVIATLSTGGKIQICEVHSGPVIVRGRSPRNFQSRKDLPLSGSAAASRKNAQASHTASASINRTSPSDSGPQSGVASARAKAGVKSSSPETSVPHPSQASPDWTQITSQGAAALPPTTMPHSSIYTQSSPEFSRPAEVHRRTSNSVAAPINLSLLDDDNSDLIHLNDHGRSLSSFSNDLASRNLSIDSSGRPAKMRKVSHVAPQTQSRSTSATVPLVGATNFQQQFASSLPFASESADVLYEYFPLPIEDWQGPVDAVYRPHVVHHTNMPQMKYVTARGQSKRYFAAEDVF
ncbi:Putative NDT80 / PhoG like DNA-binding family protein [Aspergillus calidoustus]|uniref:Putative NDT80 / PhoG like DNA-binding family protein n=1 Tax=Aspergillus calidoustus TaxID=454130 RepID=A0A0U5GAD6_ASPCI|nr:Putative NDT80 / PhoG like DNA-binding family protein [Aspergillus calidoustus]